MIFSLLSGFPAAAVEFVLSVNASPEAALVPAKAVFVNMFRRVIWFMGNRENRNFMNWHAIKTPGKYQGPRSITVRPEAKKRPPA
jgi:hypothetical protein